MIGDSGNAGKVAADVLADPGYRQAARRVQEEINSYPDPTEVLALLVGRLAR